MAVDPNQLLRGMLLSNAMTSTGSAASSLGNRGYRSGVARQQPDIVGMLQLQQMLGQQQQSPYQQPGYRQQQSSSMPTSLLQSLLGGGGSALTTSQMASSGGGLANSLGVASVPGGIGNAAAAGGTSTATGAGGTAAGGGLGSGLAAAGPYAALAALVGGAKIMETNNPDNMWGRASLSLAGPSIAQMVEDPKLAGLAAVGLPFLGGWLRDDDAARTAPEWLPGGKG